MVWGLNIYYKGFGLANRGVVESVLVTLVKKMRRDELEMGDDARKGRNRRQ